MRISRAHTEAAFERTLSAAPGWRWVSSGTHHTAPFPPPRLISNTRHFIDSDLRTSRPASTNAGAYNTHKVYFNMLGAFAWRHLGLSLSQQRSLGEPYSTLGPLRNDQPFLPRRIAPPWPGRMRRRSPLVGGGAVRAGPVGDGGGTRRRPGADVGCASLARRVAVGGRRLSRCPACSHQHLGV